MRASLSLDVLKVGLLQQCST